MSDKWLTCSICSFSTDSGREMQKHEQTHKAAPPAAVKQTFDELLDKAVATKSVPVDIKAIAKDFVDTGESEYGETYRDRELAATLKDLAYSYQVNHRVSVKVIDMERELAELRAQLDELKSHTRWPTVQHKSEVARAEAAESQLALFQRGGMELHARAHKAESQLAAAREALRSGYTKLEMCVDTFRRFADIHRAKGTPQGNNKAASNSEIADECSVVLGEIQQALSSSAPAAEAHDARVRAEALRDAAKRVLNHSNGFEARAWSDWLNSEARAIESSAAGTQPAKEPQ